MTKQLYIGEKDQADLWEDIAEWVEEKIPPPPLNLSCECDVGTCHDEEYTDTECKRVATTYLYYIKGTQVCYTYVCMECCEANMNEDYSDDDYPTTKGGYAVVPTRCIN